MLLTVAFVSPPSSHGILFGDVDCTNEVDAIDATLLLQFDAELVPSLPCEFRGDVNVDEQINAVDAALVLQYVAGLLDRLGPQQTPAP